MVTIRFALDLTHSDIYFELVLYVIVFRILDGDNDTLCSVVMEGNVDQLMVQVQIVVVVRNAAGLWTFAEIRKDYLCFIIRIINYLGQTNFIMKAILLDFGC